MTDDSQRKTDTSALELARLADERAAESLATEEPRPLTEEIPQVAFANPTDNVSYVTGPIEQVEEVATETAALRLHLGRTEKVTFGFTFAMALLAMLGPFSIDMIFPGFPAMRGDFHTDAAAMQQVTSLYLISFACMSMFHGPLSDAVGRKRVMGISLIVFSIGSLGAALAVNLPMLFAFRVLQGLSAGGATIVSRVVIRDLYGGGKAQKLMSQVMMIFALAPAAAPIFGGWILLLGPWRWIFGAMLLYALVTLVIMLIVIPETLLPEKRQPFNAKGILTSLGRVLRSPVIWRLSLALGLASQADFIFISAAPIIVPDVMHLGEQDYWVLFIPIIAGMILGNYFVGRLAFVMSRSRLITIAFITVVLGGVLSVIIPMLTPELTSQFGVWHLLVMIGPGLLGMGAALMMAPVQLEVLDMFPEERGAATSFATFVNLIVAAIASGVMVPMLGADLVKLGIGGLALSAGGAVFWFAHVLIVRRAQA